MIYRFRRNNKILKSIEYKNIFKNAKSVKNKYWQVAAQPTKLASPRLGLAISKKVCRLAVDRNRLKRIAREVFRLEQNNLQNWNFVVMARKSKSIKNSILSVQLLNLLKTTTQK